MSLDKKVVRIACNPDGEGVVFGMSVGEDGVASIEARYEDLGTYKIKWYSAFDADGFMIGQINAMGVQTVVYEQYVSG